MVDAVESLAYAGEVPWHGLGVPVHNDLTPAQMQEKAGLDWTVKKIPLTYMYEGDQQDSGKQALVRESDGRLLDVVTDDWNPLQNETAFEFFYDFVMAGDMEMHTAGSLKNGQLVFVLAKVKDTFELFGGDKVESFLLFSNPHFYAHSINIRFTPVRVVCWNTLSAALRVDAEHAVRITHRKEFDADIVKETLGIAHKKMNAYKETAEFLGSRQFTKKSVEKFFAEALPGYSKTGKISRNAQRAINTVLDEQPGAEFAKGSWWQALNACTYMIDHEIGDTVDSRMVSAWYGTGATNKERAIKKAIEYASAS